MYWGILQIYVQAFYGILKSFKSKQSILITPTNFGHFNVIYLNRFQLLTKGFKGLSIKGIPLTHKTTSFELKIYYVFNQYFHCQAHLKFNSTHRIYAPQSEQKLNKYFLEI